MNIGTWNIQGLNNKFEEVIKELEIRKQDIIVLSETKKKGNGSEIKGSFIHFYSGVQKHQRAKRGISVLIRKKLKTYVTNWQPIDENLIRINMNFHGYKLVILGVYAINEDVLLCKKDEFFNKLNGIIEEIGNTREVILAGDFNSRTGRQIGNKIIGPFGENIVNENGSRLIDICEQNSLKVLNGFYQHKEIHKYTWYRETMQQKSIIDYIIVKQKTKLKIQDVRVYRGVKLSDHFIVNSKILFPFKKLNNKDKEKEQYVEKGIKLNLPKYNLQSLENESTVYLYRKRLDEKLTETHWDTTEKQYQYISKVIHESAKEALGEIDIKDKKNTFYYWDEEIKKEVKIKKEKYLKWLNTKKIDDKIELNAQQAKIRRMVAESKNRSWEQSCQKIESFIGGKRSTEAWKTLKTLRKNSKESQQMTYIDFQTWEEYFKNLLTECREEHLEKNQNEIPETVNNTYLNLDMEIVIQAIKSMKNGRASGPGGIPAELLKYGTNKLFANLKELFEKCLNGEETPEEWKIGYISTLHKKGNKKQCENYRGITVTNTLSRIYGKIIKQYLENEYKDMEAEEQAGFRRGRSTIDHLFCLEQIIEKKVIRLQPLHLVFIDIEKAYDNVPLSKLWEVLKSNAISQTIIKAIQNLYKNSISKIKIGNNLSTGFEVTKGLRQGCCLSPTLYKIYTEKVLKNWKNKCKGMGIPVNNITIYSLQFADDQLILAQDYEDIEYMTRKIIGEYKLWGLNVNMNKTKYMVIGEKSKDLIIEEENIKRISHVEECKYLGMKITNDGKQDKEIGSKINLGKTTISMLNGILWDKHITNQTKTKIFNTIVRSIMTYGSDVWILKSTLTKKLLATEMDFWRRSARISRLDKIRNQIIRDKMEVQNLITDFVEQKQLIWYGHTKRMNDERLPKMLLEWTPPGRRRRGRPSKTWIQEISSSLIKWDIPENLWTDRDEWKNKIKNCISLDLG